MFCSLAYVTVALTLIGAKLCASQHIVSMLKLVPRIHHLNISVACSSSQCDFPWSGLNADLHEPKVEYVCVKRC